MNLENHLDDDSNLNQETNHETTEEQTTPEIQQSVESLRNNDKLKYLVEATQGIRNQLAKVVVGQTELIDLMIMAMLTKGHILIEGVPGIAKTLTAKLFAKTMNGKFSRIQFTPDLMPSDVVGTNVFNVKTQDFDFKAGPIFADVVIIDEINRAPAKTQAALFEVMQEAQVTIDGNTRKMGEGFIVLATQNPIDHEGTYILPEAQLDRFLFKANIHYPTPEEELTILRRFQNDFDMREMDRIEEVVSLSELIKLRKEVELCTIGEDLLLYIARIIQETRQTGDLYLGASTRAAIWLMKATKASAVMNGRNYATPDDVRRVTEPVLNHRIILSPQREMEGLTTSEVIEQIIQKVEVPR